MLRQFLSKVGWNSLYIVQYGCIAHCIMEYVVDFVVCSGPSMEPALYTNDIVLTDHMAVAQQKIKTGDIVIVRSPTDPKQLICKRVAATEGDKVESHKSLKHVYVGRSNPDKVFGQSFWVQVIMARSKFNEDKFTTQVPRGHVWLEGDNKSDSTDSRSYGPVPYGLVRSRVFFKIWPIHAVGSMTVAAKER